MIAGFVVGLFWLYLLTREYLKYNNSPKDTPDSRKKRAISFIILGVVNLVLGYVDEFHRQKYDSITFLDGAIAAGAWFFCAYIYTGRMTKVEDSLVVVHDGIRRLNETLSLFSLPKPISRVINILFLTLVMQGFMIFFGKWFFYNRQVLGFLFALLIDFLMNRRKTKIIDASDEVEVL